MNNDLYKKISEKIKEERERPKTKEEAQEHLRRLGLLPKPIDWDVIDKVLVALKNGPRHSLDCEDIRYFPERYPFTYEEYKDVFQWIEKYAEARNKIKEIKEDFPTCDAYFTYKGAKYYWNLMIGQGSSISLEYNPSKFDKSRSFVFNPKEEETPGYHVNKIKKGTLGEWSKVREEFEECEDALEQGVKVMVLVELSDLMGAIKSYVKTQHNMSLNDLLKMAKVTKRAFKSGKRK